MGKFKYLLFGFCLFILGNSYVYALPSASIGGNGSVVQGDKITISATVSADSSLFFIEGTLKCAGAGVDKSIDLKFETMENGKTKNTKYIELIPTSTGTIKCDLNGRATGASWSGWKSVETSKKINVVKPREKSTNNNLSKLEVEGYTLEPSFNKDVLEYSVKIDKNVEKVKINASLEDKYARVSGAGEVEVLEGANKIEVVATSETGVSKTYVLNIDVKDSNPVIEKIDGKDYTVIKRIKSLPFPETLDKSKFKEATVKINEIDVAAYTSDELGYSIVGLKDSDGNIYIYKYEANNITSRYEAITSKSITIVFTEPESILDGFEKTAIKVNNRDYTAYKKNSTILIYGKELNSDEAKWYQYNDKEESIQSFDTNLIDELNSKQKELDDLNNKYKLTIIVAGCAIGLLLIILIIVSSKKKNNKNKPEAKKEEKVVKLVEKEKPVVKEEPKVTKKIAKEVEKKKEATDELEKIEKEIKKAQEEVDDIPDFREIEKDLKDEDELMDPYDFLDIKKKRRRK